MGPNFRHPNKRFRDPFNEERRELWNNESESESDLEWTVESESDSDVELFRPPTPINNEVAHIYMRPSPWDSETDGSSLDEGDPNNQPDLIPIPGGFQIPADNLTPRTRRRFINWAARQIRREQRFEQQLM